MTAKKLAIDAIIHIGAGRGKDLKQHLAIGARKIVLIDADSEAMAPLKRLAGSAMAPSCDIDVVEAAVAGEEKYAQLHIYNLERVSGICAPNALADIYPGLKELRTAKVKTRAAADMVKDLGVDHDQENMLVVDAPGEELPILKCLADANMLSAFSRIKVNASREALYKGGATASEITSFLEEASFLVTAEDHGDWVALSVLIWRSRLHRLEMERVNKELARVETARAAHEKKVIELSKQNSNMAAEIEKQKIELAALDLVDRESLFKTELSRCESQLDHLKGLFAHGDE